MIREAGGMTIDLFALKSNDARTLVEVIDLLAQHCDVGQVEHFLTDLERWHRLQGRRFPQRDRDDAEIELRQWQHFINRLPEVAHDQP